MRRANSLEKPLMLRKIEGRRRRQQRIKMVERHHCLNGHEVKWKLFMCFDSLQPHGLYSPWNSPDQNTGVGCHFHLQGNFPNQGLNPGLPHFRMILYQLSHQGSPNGHEFEQTQGDIEGQGNPLCRSPWGHKELDMTEQLNNNNKNSKLSLHPFPVPSLATTLLIFFFLNQNTATSTWYL